MLKGLLLPLSTLVRFSEFSATPDSPSRTGLLFPMIETRCFFVFEVFVLFMSMVGAVMMISGAVQGAIISACSTSRVITTYLEAYSTRLRLQPQLEPVDELVSLIASLKHGEI